MVEKRYITGVHFGESGKKQYISRAPDRKGFFVVVDGLEGVGKGVVERALVEYEQKLDKAVFDSVAFSKAHLKGLPDLIDFWNPPEVAYHTVVTAEPSHTGIGRVVRNEIVANNGRPYSASIQVQAYSLDRLVQMKKVVIPALQNGLSVIQARCWLSTLVYQTLQAEKEGRPIQEVRNEILGQEGTKLQLEYSPDLLIIPTVKDAEEVIRRIEARKEHQKDDKSIFDNIETQRRMKISYEDSDLVDFFADYGTQVVYIDAGISLDETVRQTVEAYKKFLEDPLAFVRERDKKFGK